MLELFGLDRDDPGDLQDFVWVLFKICGLVFIVLSTVIMWQALFGDGHLPPEPAWWLAFEKMIGVTW